MRSASWLALVWLLASALVALSARAQSPERARACADASSALDESLPSEDRTFLETLCSFSDAEARAWSTSNGAERVRFERLVARLTSRGEWESRILFELLPPGLFEPAPYHWRCNDRRRTTTALDHVVEVLASSRPGAGGLTLASARRSLLPPGCSLEPTSVDERGDAEARAAGVPLLVLAPPGMRVRLLAVDGAVHTARLEELPQQGAHNVALYPALVRHGSQYLVAVDAPRAANSARGHAYPAILRGDAFGTVQLESTESLRAGCLDVQVKSDREARLLVDGVRVHARRDGLLHTAALSLAAARERSQHRLTVFIEGDASAVVNRTVVLDRSRVDPCVEVRFDLTTRVLDDTVGLLDVDAEACVDAGIDTPRLLSYVTSYLTSSGRRVRDLRSWALAAQYIADLRRTLNDFQNAAVGADRGRLDSIKNLATGAEELLRQGFSSLLLSGLRCSRRSGSGWDYSFIARYIDLGELRRRSRDPITGISIDDVEQTSIELVTNRSELGPRIDGALGRLVGVPTLVVRPLPHRQPYVKSIRATAEVYAPAAVDGRSAGYVLSIAARRLQPAEADDICPRIADIHRLRIQRNYADLDAGNWRGGTARRIEPNGAVTRVLLTFEPDAAQTLLVRTALNDATPAQRTRAASYQCVDLSRDGAELWAEVGGWFPLGSASPARTEESGAVNALLGVDWQQAAGWLSLGAGVGFSHTVRSGHAPSTWAGLGEAEFAADGRLPYTIRENASYLLFHAQARGSICQPWWPAMCSSATRRTMLTARLLVLPGLHIVALDQVADTLREFTDGATVKTVIDVGALFQPGLAIQFSRSMTFNGRLSFGTHRLFDFFSRSPAHAEVHRRALWGTSMGLAWDF